MAASTSMVSTAAAVTTINRVAPFNGLKSSAAFPAIKKSENDFTSISTNGGRVQCIQVWPTTGLKKFETLSYLPPLTEEQLAKEVDYLLRNNWVPCLEFQLEELNGFVHREYNSSPGYYDGRYWTMWKLPMFGCTDSSQVLKELAEAKKAYPSAFVRIIGFDNKRQVQCISFIAAKPDGYK
ncbi:ribulose bisphosphate carboxylase small subunit, chloroplastic-like [Impatiens glandulifera]|uniref:ribulose bisphosphate carboxylase small subunit, chloroplastic-like n=1 Tax=Impatiens glandulifera TaxID=253017 RepID=UPI001FB0F840|nr:ribulose bisphosphate carboxylase small subunit, chloroplastic-like [Impatiens glandulifera]XP_047314200.1 ribulose bisphosphate carboxylase small subunit, chloroplastic-like [Impatiens glandulifera]XP_047314208.1 ribulose bisphosphate carboxylase small subunit, chloroplastic-like [Impatiens glandulifera]XP_047330130.1 ribulose bisphosphate carboxylase small subunit, chloroplastic-like [Impatiens glandulifera]XP_047330131.1 ribulose bisphosphate carboxylase small subunit, chloroplastic-like 